MKSRVCIRLQILLLFFVVLFCVPVSVVHLTARGSFKFAPDRSAGVTFGCRLKFTKQDNYCRIFPWLTPVKEPKNRAVKRTTSKNKPQHRKFTPSVGKPPVSLTRVSQKEGTTVGYKYKKKSLRLKEKVTVESGDKFVHSFVNKK